MNIRSHTLILSLAGMAVLVSGCVNPDGTQNNTGTGAIVGGAFGALAGAALGGRGHGGTDALIGAAAGALAGGLIGNSADQQQAAMINDQQPVTYEQVVTPPPPLPPPPVSQPAPQPMSIADVEALAKSGVSEEVMIAQIKNSQTIFHLDAGQIIDLRDAGVPASVVNFMINTPAAVSATTPPAPEISANTQSTPPSTTTAVADTTPNLIWIDGEWVWNDSGWVWVDGHWGQPPHPGAVWIAGRSWKDDHGWHNERGHWQ